MVRESAFVAVSAQAMLEKESTEPHRTRGRWDANTVTGRLVRNVRRPFKRLHCREEDRDREDRTWLLLVSVVKILGEGL